MIQRGLDVVLPMRMNDHIDETIPVEATLNRVAILPGDGTERLGLQLFVEVDLPKNGSANIASVLPKVPRPGGPNEAGPTGFAGQPLPMPPKPFGNDTAQTDLIDEPKSSAKSVTGTATVRVGIRYDPATASFFCHNATAETLELAGLPNKMLPPIKQLCELAINGYFKTHPITTLDNADASTNIAKSRLKKVVFRDNDVIVTIGI
ncbi:MAG: hypothetical protein AAF745_13710 [Planctomycetota bacterium]